jgi:acyl dehydratase
MPSVKFADLPSLEGKDIGTSDWLLIDQDRVNMFADATGDHQWIHIDVERAKAVPFLGGTIAHGFLTLSLIPFLASGLLSVEGVTHGINYGSDKVRFINMVHVGKRVRLHQKLLSATPKSGGWLMKNEFTIEIEGEAKPALIAENLSMIFGA